MPAFCAKVGSTLPRWRVFWHSGNGQRYYLVPMAMLLFALSALVGCGKTNVSRWIAATLLLILGVTGERNDWKLPAFTDFQFRKYVALYRSVPPGSCVTVPINPPGWQMKLRKPAQQKDPR
jgi:hypothetical protein